MNFCGSYACPKCMRVTTGMTKFLTWSWRNQKIPKKTFQTNNYEYGPKTTAWLFIKVYSCLTFPLRDEALSPKSWLKFWKRRGFKIHLGKLKNISKGIRRKKKKRKFSQKKNFQLFKFSFFWTLWLDCSSNSKFHGDQCKLDISKRYKLHFRNCQQGAQFQGQY